MDSEGDPDDERSQTSKSLRRLRPVDPFARGSSSSSAVRSSWPQVSLSQPQRATANSSRQRPCGSIINRAPIGDRRTPYHSNALSFGPPAAVSLLLLPSFYFLQPSYFGTHALQRPSMAHGDAGEANRQGYCPWQMTKTMPLLLAILVTVQSMFRSH